MVNYITCPYAKDLSVVVVIYSTYSPTELHVFYFWMMWMCCVAEVVWSGAVEVTTGQAVMAVELE